MERKALISLFLAVIAAGLVIFAGKSCTQNIQEINKKNRRDNPSQKYSLITDTTSQPDMSDYYGFQDNDPQLIEETTERQYETVTNILGDVIETIPVTSPEEANMPTTTLSILDEYNKRVQGEPSSVESTSRYIAPKEDITLYID